MLQPARGLFDHAEVGKFRDLKARRDEAEITGEVNIALQRREIGPHVRIAIIVVLGVDPGEALGKAAGPREARCACEASDLGNPTSGTDHPICLVRRVDARVADGGAARSVDRRGPHRFIGRAIRVPVTQIAATGEVPAGGSQIIDSTRMAE